MSHSVASLYPTPGVGGASTSGRRRPKAGGGAGGDEGRNTGTGRRNGGAAATASQSWSILLRHARDEVGPLRLQELCQDEDRVSSLVAVHNGDGGDGGGDDDGDDGSRILLVDLSRQRMTLETVNHLLRLADSRDVRGFVRRLAWGQNDPDNPVAGAAVLSRDPAVAGVAARGKLGKDGSQSMHMALRAPAGRDMRMMTADGSNALDGVHLEWQRIRRLADSVRGGHLRGSSGQPLRDVVVVGKGVAVAALRFLYEALRRDGAAGRAAAEGVSRAGIASPRKVGGARGADDGTDGPFRRMRFISSVDPASAESAVSDLAPGSTLVISLALRANEETERATKNVYEWMRRGLPSNIKPEYIVSHHFFLVTGNERLQAAKPNNAFLVPDHSRCEAFVTFSAAGLLPLTVVFGWPTVERILAGAHDMDSHFVETNPRHNLPILLALSDVWNDAFLNPSSGAGRVVSPFSECLSAYPAFVAALESETCGRSHDRRGRTVAGGEGGGGGGWSAPRCPAAVVVDGGMGGEYDRALYQGGRVWPSELVASMDGQAGAGGGGGSANVPAGGVTTPHDDLMCSLFAHADVLAFGSGGAGGGHGNGGFPSSASAASRPPMGPYGSPPPSSSVSSSTFAFEGIGSSSSSPGGGLGGGGGGVGSYASAEGNRPSTLLLCTRCDAFACGQLVAIAEHRAVVAARLWDVDPFSTDVGASLREAETERLKEKLRHWWVVGGDADDDDGDEGGEGSGDGGGGAKMNLATKTILGHYSNRVRGQR